MGDLPGLTSRLDYLAGTPHSLGVDAIWISPFYPSPMADFGYDVADHCAVDPVFGTLDDFDELIAQAHHRGIRVIVDLVANHTSDRHQWFRESRSDPANPKRSWFVWRPSRDGGPPNNWMSEWGGPAWTRDDETDEWYLHSFLPQQPDLNWDEPRVEEAIHEVMGFWLKRGVDGFRADVIHKIGKAPDLRDNFGIYVGPGPNDRGCRFDEDWPTVHGRIRRMRRRLRTFGDRIMVGEVYVLNPEQLAPYVRTGRELDLAHNFHFLTLPWNAGAFQQAIEGYQDLLLPRGWPTWCLNNHDHPRVASRYPGERAARVAAMLLLTLRGTPFLYQGEELGLEDGTIPASAIVDVAGRDPERCPIPWDVPSAEDPGAGFSTGRPWLPLPPDAETRNVRTEQADVTSMLSLYRRLLKVRREQVALRSGTYTPVRVGDPNVLAYRRQANGASFVVVLNFGADGAFVRAAELGTSRQRTVELDTSLVGPGSRPLGDRLELEPLSGMLIRET